MLFVSHTFKSRFAKRRVNIKQSRVRHAETESWTSVRKRGPGRMSLNAIPGKGPFLALALLTAPARWLNVGCSTGTATGRHWQEISWKPGGVDLGRGGQALAAVLASSCVASHSETYGLSYRLRSKYFLSRSLSHSSISGGSLLTALCGPEIIASGRCVLAACQWATQTRWDSNIRFINTNKTGRALHYYFCAAFLVTQRWDCDCPRFPDAYQANKPFLVRADVSAHAFKGTLQMKLVTNMFNLQFSEVLQTCFIKVSGRLRTVSKCVRHVSDMFQKWFRTFQKIQKRSDMVQQVSEMHRNIFSKSALGFRV